jgi:hypothetical protein
MLDGMGLALGDADEDEDLFANDKETDKKSENEANW